MSFAFQSTTPDREPDKHAYPYWMVWGPSRFPPQRRHLSADLAMTEAERLSLRHRGKRFYVLCVIGSAKADAIHE